MKVSAKRSDSDVSVEVEYNFGANLGEAVELFGEDVVFNNAIGSLKVALQGFLRSQIDQKKTDEEITAAASTWKPGVRKQGKSPQQKLIEQLNAMSPEDRAALLKEYKAKAA